MSSVNLVILVGNLGNDPDIRTMQNGNKVCNLSVATSESWKDKSSGERKEKTEWHRVVVFNEGLINICENYLKKGSKIYLQGKIETRSWDKDGVKQYSTEIVLKGFDSKITMVGSKPQAGNQGSYQEPVQAATDELEDDSTIPF